MIKFFTIYVRSLRDGESELNGFLSRHKILSMRREWVDCGHDSYWAIAVDYQISSESQPRQDRSVATHRNRVDYKTVLSESEFVVYSRLREWRKVTAQQEAIPLYNVFSNDQLAQFVQSRCQSTGDLLKIDGASESRISKYGVAILEIIKTLTRVPDEADRPVV
jgi:superfamily II DNA helicase RecQ